MPAPNSLPTRISFYQRQVTNPSQDWSNLCLMLCRISAGVGPRFSSAWTHWLGTPGEDKHVGGTPADAPVGTFLHFKGSGPYGHIEMKKYPNAPGEVSAFSNDLLRYGKVDAVPASLATSKWGQAYLGYTLTINGYDVLLAPSPEPTKPPEPVESKHYGGIGKAIERLKHAREQARKNGDHDDAKHITVEIRRLKAADRKLRR